MTQELSPSPARSNASKRRVSEILAVEMQRDFSKEVAIFRAEKSLAIEAPGTASGWNSHKRMGGNGWHAVHYDFFGKEQPKQMKHMNICKFLEDIADSAIFGFPQAPDSYTTSGWKQVAKRALRLVQFVKAGRDSCKISVVRTTLQLVRWLAAAQSMLYIYRNIFDLSWFINIIYHMSYVFVHHIMILSLFILALGTVRYSDSVPVVLSIFPWNQAFPLGLVGN